MKPRTKTDPTESEIMNQTADLLNITGWFVLRVNSGQTRNVPWVRWLDNLGLYHCKGTSDIIAARDGKVLFIECKKPGGKMSDDQREFKKQAERTGNKCLTIDDPNQLVPFIE